MDVRKDLFKNIIFQNQKVSERIDFRERRNILRGRSKVLRGRSKIYVDVRKFTWTFETGKFVRRGRQRIVARTGEHFKP